MRLHTRNFLNFIKRFFRSIYKFRLGIDNWLSRAYLNKKKDSRLCLNFEFVLTGSVIMLTNNSNKKTIKKSSLMKIFKKQKKDQE
jgi:hypothetical protein